MHRCSVGAALVGVGLVGSMSGCSHAGTADDRAQARETVAGIAAEFLALGYTSSAPASVQGSCTKHRSSLVWSQALTPRALALPAHDRSNAASDTFVAHLGTFKLSSHSLAPDGYETDVAKNGTGSILTFSVSGGTSVHVIGSIAC